MHPSLLFLVPWLFASNGMAAIHRLYTSNISPPASIHLLEFDDEMLTLVKTQTIEADNAHAWIAFDVRAPHPSEPARYDTTRRR